MPSITPMMSTIFFDDSLIAAIVPTTSATTLPPRCATSEADSASMFACRALSAFWRTVPVNCSTEAAVACSVPFWRSVRLARSRLPSAISVDTVPIARVPLRTWATMRTRLSRMPCIANSRLLRSPGRVTISTPRSPPAMALAIEAA